VSEAVDGEERERSQPWLFEELLELANDPMAVASAWHLSYVRRKP